MNDQSCVKCGFTQTPDGRQFKKEYKDRCYGSVDSCSWADTDIREHLHLICPDCGYTVGAQACTDFKEQKDKKNKAWTGVGSLNNRAATIAPPTTGRRYIAGQGYVDVKDGWDTAECVGCPVSKDAETPTTP